MPQLKKADDVSLRGKTANPGPVWIWGLPLTPFTFQETLEEVDRLIQVGTPCYFITANLNYAMLTAQDQRLQAVNQEAAFLLADGMPLVWASRWKKQRLPERVAGSDLVPALCENAANKGYKIFLLGGGPNVGQEAANRLCSRFPRLQIVGIEVPPFREQTSAEQTQMIDRIRKTKPDLLFAAFTQPKGELWLQEHLQELQIPVCAQIGATLDFMAGRVRRAPRWIQRLGFEWAYRFYQEPKRLFLRYVRNGLFIFRMLARDVLAAVMK